MKTAKILQTLKLLFLPPKDPLWKQAIYQLEKTIPEDNPACLKARKLTRKIIETIHQQNLLELEKEYTRLHINAVGGIPCPLYLSPYKSPNHTLMHPPITKPLQQTLDQLGLEIDKTYAAAPDHISILAELTAILLSNNKKEQAINIHERYLDPLLKELSNCILTNAKTQTYKLLAELLSQLRECLKLQILFET